MKIHNLAVLLFFQFLFAFTQAIELPQAASKEDSTQQTKRDKPVTANIIFKLEDGGQTWQDISEGLPENLQPDGIPRDGFLANDQGIYLRAGHALYQREPNSAAPFWKKEPFPDQQSGIVAGKTGMLAFNYGGQFLQKANGASLWTPVYADFKGKSVRTVSEIGDNVFIGCDWGLYKSNDEGKNWERVYDGGWVMKLVASDGVLLATSQTGIIRSTDDGQTWVNVISEGASALLSSASTADSPL